MCRTTTDRHRKSNSWMMQCTLLAILLVFVCSTSQAQVRIMPAPVNAPILELTMYDDGCGVAISDSAGVYVTHDHWETSSKVIPPGVETNLEFVPRSVDTASTGAIVVVGFLRTGRNDGPIFTYAMRSSDHGRTWEEIGVRRSGRFQSMSFRGSEFGLVVYEMRQSNKRGPSDTFAIYVERVGDRLTVLSTVTFIAPKETDFNCYAGQDAVTCVITSLGSAGALLSVVAPCLWLNLEEPQPSFYYTRLYRSRSFGGDFELVTTLPASATERVDRYRSPKTKEAVFSQRSYTGLNGLVTVDDGEDWNYRKCLINVKCKGLSALYIESVVSDSRYGQCAASTVATCFAGRPEVVTMYLYLVPSEGCDPQLVDSLDYTWPYGGLESASSFASTRDRDVLYGRGGMITTTFYSYYIDDTKTRTIDSLFLFVLKPTSATSAPNSHADEQLMPNIRVTASSIHVRIPIHTQVDRTLRIVDVTGREIRSHDVATENEEFYIGGLPPGMYYAYMPGVRAVPFCNP